jgi:hypothetical protein
MHVFAIAETGRGPYWLLLPVLLILVVVGGLLGASVYGANHARFELSAEGLRLRGDLYGRFIPRAQLNVAGARRLGPDDKDLEPGLRTMGTGLPGYKAGWFRLHNGEKALLYLTDRSRAVYIPTSAGYSVLLSPADPDGFLRALAQP